MASPRFREAIEKRIREQDELAAAIQGSIDAELARGRRFKFLFFLAIAGAIYGLQAKLMNDDLPLTSDTKKISFQMIKNQIAKEIQQKRTGETLTPSGDDEEIGKELVGNQEQVANKIASLPKVGGAESARVPSSLPTPQESSGTALAKESGTDPDSPDLPKSESSNIVADNNGVEDGESENRGDGQVRSLASQEGSIRADSKENLSSGSTIESNDLQKQAAQTKPNESAASAEKKASPQPISSSLKTDSNPYRMSSAAESKRVQGSSLPPTSVGLYDSLEAAPKKFKKENMASTLSPYEWR